MWCYAAEPRGLGLQSLLYHALMTLERLCHHQPGLAEWKGKLCEAGSAQGSVPMTERCCLCSPTKAAFRDFMGFSSLIRSFFEI